MERAKALVRDRICHTAKQVGVGEVQIDGRIRPGGQRVQEERAKALVRDRICRTAKQVGAGWGARGCRRGGPQAQS